MKSFLQILLAVLLSVTATYFLLHHSPTDTRQKESAYERVVRTQTLRCGYALWPTLVDKDPNTGALSGVFVDYMAEISKNTGLKVEWTTELGFGDFVEALRVGRIDALCSGAWTNAKRGMVVEFVTPISYQGVTAYARADDHRFDNNLIAINSEAITVVGLEGSSTQAVPETYFPKAKLVLLPQLSDESQMLINVMTGKADIAFSDINTVSKFLENNPGALRAVPADYPVSLFGNPIAVAKGEMALKTALDNATLQLINIGVIERILKKHEKYPGSFYRPAPTFRTN